MGYFTENLLGNPKKWTFHKHMAYGGAAGESAEGVPEGAAGESAEGVLEGAAEEPAGGAPGGAVVIAAGVGP